MTDVTPPIRNHNINDSQKYCSKNCNLKLSHIKLQVESNCLCVFLGREYSTSLRCVRILRLSALSVQMASQLAALTLLSLPDLSHRSNWCCHRITLSVCRGEPSHSTHSDGNVRLLSRPSGAARTEDQTKGNSTPAAFITFNFLTCK